MLLAKAPPSYGSYCPNICNVVLQDKKATAAMETEKVAAAMRNSWEPMFDLELRAAKPAVS